jgi:MFS transporter, DHA1 family, inner membrane transport protein
MPAASPHPVAVLAPIGLMAFAGYTTGSGMRMLDPLLPMVAADFNVPVAGATSLVAGFLLPYGLGQIGIGPLGDRYGKLRVACLAVLAYAVLMLAGALAGGLASLTLLRVLAGLAAGAVIPLMIAHLGDVVPYGDRQGVIGRFSTGMVMAQLITGPIAGVLGGLAGWRAVFLLLGVLALLAGVLLVWRLGAAVLRAGPQGSGRGRTLEAYAALLSRPAGRWLLSVSFANGFCLFGGAFPFIGSYLIEQFGLSAALAGMVVAGFGLGSLTYTRLADWLVRRYGERRLMLRGGIGLAMGLAGLALAPSWPWVLGLQIWLGLAFYMFHGVLQARATEVLPDARGTAMAGFAMSLFLGQSVGSLAFGLGLAAIGYRGAFALAATGVLALAVWARLGVPRRAETMG